MRLANFLVVTFGIGVISYPAINLPVGRPFFVDNGKRQAEPEPRPKSTKSGYAMLELIDDNNLTAVSQKEREYRIIINVPATRLTLYEGEEPVFEFPVAVGQAVYKTPTGRQEIKKIEWNPWWYPPKSEWAKDEKITPPGPKNPLGPVKMPMSEDIRLHGTNKDSSIGRAASHGCIRMHSEDAVALAWYLQQRLTDKDDPAYLEKYKKSGSRTFHVLLDRPVTVEIVYEPVAFNEGVITIYPDIYGRIKDMRGIVEWKLYRHGINPWGLKLENIPKSVRKPIDLNISDFM